MLMGLQIPTKHIKCFGAGHQMFAIVEQTYNITKSCLYSEIKNSGNQIIESILFKILDFEVRVELFMACIFHGLNLPINFR